MDYDIAVIGGGPAGVSAAITAASKGRKVVLFEAHGFSPRLRSVAQITDYMGIPDISGTALMDIFVNHLKQMEVDIIEAKIISLREVGEGFMLGTPHGEYSADSVVLATGISRSTLFPGEKEFLGKGVSYCAVVDADKYKGKSVAAIATVPDALEEVEYLAEQCEHVFFFRLQQGKFPDFLQVTVQPLFGAGRRKVGISRHLTPFCPAEVRQGLQRWERTHRTSSALFSIITLNDCEKLHIWFYWNVTKTHGLVRRRDRGRCPKRQSAPPCRREAGFRTPAIHP